jgi:CO/xanthine dehydrogenase Mo-binding subunit
MRRLKRFPRPLTCWLSIRTNRLRYSRIEIEHLETVPLDTDVNFRGVGEGGMIVAPPTVVNAIEDALSPFGVRIYEQHLPPARILELIAAPDSGQ